MTGVPGMFVAASSSFIPSASSPPELGTSFTAALARLSGVERTVLRRSEWMESEVRVVLPASLPTPRVRERDFTASGVGG